MNDYQHDRQAEIRFHLQGGPVILRSREEFEEAVFQIYTNPERWMEGKRLASSPMDILDPKHYPFGEYAVRIQLH